jgi:hypothetical protein
MIDLRHDRYGEERAMTSGEGGYQGGQRGGPGNEPGQGWNAPPAPPPQYSGYAPAPSAPSGYGAPTPVERPFAVRAGLGAFIASLILGLISSVLTFSDIDGLVAAAMTASDDPALTESIVRSGLVVGGVIAVILYALYVMFIWFAWNGRNWARIVLWVLGGLSVVSSLASLGMGTSPLPAYLTALSWFSFALTVAAIVLLAQKPANEWYRYCGWLRATGQRR